MTLVAAVPVKRLDDAKSRLGGAVADRPALALALLETVLGALRASGAVDRIVVVSPDPRVQQACPAGTFLLQRSRGLNPALDEAREEAMAGGATALLVVLADLAELTPEAVRRLVACAPPGRGAVAAPDREDVGTNALLLRPPDLMDFRFGRDSLRRHQEEARRHGVELGLFRTPETMNDVDTPEHLQEKPLP